MTEICKLVYEAYPGPLFFTDPVKAVLRCSVHNCLVIVAPDMCIVGQMKALEARVAKLESGQ